MTTLPILPLIASLVGVPAATPTPHPHHHKISVVPCVKGRVTVQWFTVPFNPDQLKNLKPNYVWSRGFSLRTDVNLKCGEVTIAPGHYALAFQLDDKAKNWNVVLSPAELTQLQRQLARARRNGDNTDEIRKKLEALAKKRLVLPATKFAGDHAEHMEMVAINHGYPITDRRNTEPTAGVKAEYRISFGDLHTSFAFEEVLPQRQKDGNTPR